MTNRRELNVILLTVAGGAVDAIIIMGFNVLTAAQTGNTILLSVALAQGKFALGVSAAVSVLAFVAGVAIGQGFLSALPDRWRIRAALGFETMLLLLLFGSWHRFGVQTGGEVEWLLIACAAAAMGVQSAVILNLRARSTTYITGMLAGFMTGVVSDLIAKISNHSSKGAILRDPQTSGSWRAGVAWLTYGAAAILTGLMFIQFGPIALVLPLLAVASVIAIGTDG